jgi:hypothetical protein
MREFHKESIVIGMETAIEQLLLEFKICKEEFKDDDKKINTIRLVLSRSIGLIEDEMIQYGANISANQYTSKLL